MLCSQQIGRVLVFSEAPVGLVPPSLTSLSPHLPDRRVFVQHIHLTLFAGIINGGGLPQPFLH